MFGGILEEEIEISDEREESGTGALFGVKADFEDWDYDDVCEEEGKEEENEGGEHGNTWDK